MAGCAKLVRPTRHALGPLSARSEDVKPTLWMPRASSAMFVDAATLRSAGMLKKACDLVPALLGARLEQLLHWQDRFVAPTDADRQARHDAVVAAAGASKASLALRGREVLGSIPMEL
ncbi:MAG: hypothetical protein M1826_002842 [Phylliscum demangeonii]|nr:MAG: hypothetical protein M1826_002842 [Phylliscum demangeonii]